MKEQTPTSAKRKPYDSDITDVQWNILEPILPSPKRRGRPRKTNLREVVNVLRGDCPWWRASTRRAFVRIRIYGIIGFSGFCQLVFDCQALTPIRLGGIFGYGEKGKS